MSDSTPRPSLFQRLAPGILVAATGVGAGDLINASLAGSELGLAILWAAWVGAILKWLLNEGIARWQLTTGKTLMEGWLEELGPWVGWLFLSYLIVWTVAVGAAIIKACGVAGAALFGGSGFWWGLIHTLLGIGLVLSGRFELFEKVMSLFIGLMFLTVTGAALKVGHFSDPAFWKGLFVPLVPKGGLGWTLGVMGGVGGTVTLLSYGYWIKEQGRDGKKGLKACWLDLAVGYAMTASFGASMIVIGSLLKLKKGGGVALAISELLGQQISPHLGLIFLVGFWAAVFSSLLGVWQGVPYLFADFQRLRRREPLPETGLLTTRDYRGYLLFLGLVPLLLQGGTLKEIALLYAILGSLFMPFLAATLLYLNGWLARGEERAAPWWVNTGLVLTLAFFGYQGYLGVVGAVGKFLAP